MKAKLSKDIQQLVMMGDSSHLVLLRADFSEPNNFKGVVKLICEHKMVVDITVEKADEKRLNLGLLMSPLG